MSNLSEVKDLGASRGDTPADGGASLADLIAELRATADAVVADDPGSAPMVHQKAQKGGIIAFGVALPLTYVANRIGSAWLLYGVLFLLAFGTTLLAVFAMSNGRTTWRELKTLDADMLGQVGKNLSRWHDTIAAIREKYSPAQIDFAHDYVASVAAQLRSRISYVVGALDKVGIIPLLATVGFTLVKGITDGSIPTAWVSVPVVGGIFYFVMFRFIGLAFTLERFAAILKSAAAGRSDPLVK